MIANLYDRNADNSSSTDYLLRLKDNKDQWIHCYKCGKTALGGRMIVPCDYCSLHWHLDCLDPPLANPPPRGNKSSRPPWRCPNHIEHSLKNLATTVMPAAARHKKAAASEDDDVSTRTRKVRKPKNPRVVDAASAVPNEGIIEVAMEESDEEFAEEDRHGRIYRVPERAIKLDFIERAKRYVFFSLWLIPLPPFHIGRELPLTCHAQGPRRSSPPAPPGPGPGPDRLRRPLPRRTPGRPGLGSFRGP